MLGHMLVGHYHIVAILGNSLAECNVGVQQALRIQQSLTRT